MPAAQVFYPVLGYVKAELIVNCFVVLIVLSVVALRVIGRLAGPGLGWDDAFVIFAAVRTLPLRNFGPRLTTFSL